MSFLGAVVQLTTTTDPQGSVQAATELVKEAAGLGAQFIALPENVSFMGTEEDKQKLAEPLDGPTFRHFAELADALGVHLLAGSLPEVGPDPDRAYNSSVLYGPQGQTLAVYRKIHLFDIALGEGATHLESTSVTPGEHLSLAKTPLASIGLSICYDLRFAELYRALRRAGAEMLCVPAAFTVPTGRDHWQVLLRARAIENQAYVLAPAQFGENTPTRRTFGRAVIIDPWGTVVAQCPDEPSVAIAKIDVARVHSLRTKLPCLDHERPDRYRIEP